MNLRSYVRLLGFCGGLFAVSAPAALVLNSSLCYWAALLSGLGLAALLLVGPPDKRGDP